MSEVSVKKVIISHQSRRGDGNKTPIRVITQVFDFKGNLIAEKDPFTDARYTMADMMAYAKYLIDKDLNNNSVNFNDFIAQYERKDSINQW